jgi:hypothetical protein
MAKFISWFSFFFFWREFCSLRQVYNFEISQKFWIYIYVYIYIYIYTPYVTYFKTKNPLSPKGRFFYFFYTKADLR